MSLAFKYGINRTLSEGFELSLNMAVNFMVRPDCAYYKGDKPCRFKRLCEGCTNYKPIRQKILVIKCRAQGDVLRTTALLPGLKRKYPESHITWVVDQESVELLENSPGIDRVLPFTFENTLPLLVEKFDALYSLDKEPELTALATKISSLRKYGFGLNEFGNLMIFNEASAYALRLGIDDHLKFHENQKTYQEIVSEAAELEYRKDDYVFELPEETKQKALAFFRKRRIPKHKINVGLNTGAGTKFKTKQWPKEYFLKLIPLLATKLKANVFLLGGGRETAMNAEIKKKSKVKLYDTGTDNTLLEFAGYLSLMDITVCSDTLAMHLALALKKKTVVLFGSTCPQEIELYGRGVKLFAGSACAPCYRQTCPDMICMKALTPEQVFKAVRDSV